jgi:hypothetical protein
MNNREINYGVNILQYISFILIIIAFINLFSFVVAVAYKNHAGDIYFEPGNSTYNITIREPLKRDTSEGSLIAGASLDTLYKFRGPFEWELNLESEIAVPLLNIYNYSPGYFTYYFIRIIYKQAFFILCSFIVFSFIKSLKKHQINNEKNVKHLNIISIGLALLTLLNCLHLNLGAQLIDENNIIINNHSLAIFPPPFFYLLFITIFIFLLTKVYRNWVKE